MYGCGQYDHKGIFSASYADNIYIYIYISIDRVRPQDGRLSTQGLINDGSRKQKADSRNQSPNSSFDHHSNWLRHRGSVRRCNRQGHAARLVSTVQKPPPPPQQDHSFMVVIIMVGLSLRDNVRESAIAERYQRVTGDARGRHRLPYTARPASKSTLR
ncbi:hypothetical protein LY78DRAFT_50832 [Colletotrichum sublineola]|nr:hypothetical protein LY78DRAFT_50832 [Colletotrichum sublineola]